MLLLLQDLPRRGAEWGGEIVTIGCNPEVIDTVVPTKLMGFDGDVCQVTIGEKVRFIAGSVDDIAALVNACYATEEDLGPEKPAKPCEPEDLEDTALTSSSP